MRLWSLHPRYLDGKGLVALWREALLAQAVLKGNTRGYRHHPQLDRFKLQSAPASAIAAYLRGVHAESVARGYSFDRGKVGAVRGRTVIRVSSGQLEHEWRHLMAKLQARDPQLRRRLRAVKSPECHPLFTVVPGEVEAWER